MLNRIIFFIGTEAELIKIFPIMIEAKKRGIEYSIISSGQNDIKSSVILNITQCGPIDLELSKESDIKKNFLGLLSWWVKTYKHAFERIKKKCNLKDIGASLMIVHGDTISTLMGAMIGKKLGMRVCHIEAGLRSHNLLNPFPEEIDRLLTSRMSRIHFAPGKEAFNNLQKAEGSVIDTVDNTLLDSLRYSINIPVDPNIQEFIHSKYFVFIMHRQENLINRRFVRSIVSQIWKASKKCKCIIILHAITKNAFEKYGILNKLKENPNIVLFPRMQYFDFMKVLYSAKFVITDGGSNQEELFYMGKSALILRRNTERKEGLGINARLFDGTPEDVKKFIEEHIYDDGDMDSTKYIDTDSEPSKIIVDELLRYL